MGRALRRRLAVMIALWRLILVAAAVFSAINAVAIAKHDAGFHRGVAALLRGTPSLVAVGLLYVGLYGGNQSGISHAGKSGLGVGNVGFDGGPRLNRPVS